MIVRTTKEVEALVGAMREAGLTGITVRDIAFDGLSLISVKAPCVAYGWADLYVTIDPRLGTATWLLRDRSSTLANCPDCRHVLMKSLLSDDLVDAFIGSESGVLFVGCAGAATVNDSAAVEALLESIPLVAGNGRDMCRVFLEHGGDPRFALLAALNVTDLYDCRPEMVGMPHPMFQMDRTSAPCLALPPAPEH